MKKNKLLFILVASLLSLSSLAGCNDLPSDLPGGGSDSDIGDSTSRDGGQGGDQGNSSSQSGGGGGGQNSNSSQNGGDEDPTDWTDAEKALMRNRLYGEVLPYINIPLTLREQNSQLLFYGNELSMEAGTLSRYAEKFTVTDGWEGGDVSALEGLSNGIIYSFDKEVSVTGGKRVINATFYGQSSTGEFSPSGRFIMYATDPYEYEYPEQFINQWLSQQFGTECYIPAVQADYFDLYEEGVLRCYSDTNLEESFKRLITQAGFTIEPNKDSEGYFVAHPRDGSYLLLFKYDSDLGALILKVEAVKGWNASLVSNFYKKYNQTPLEFPSLDVDGASYKFMEDTNNATYVSSGLSYMVNASYTISKRGLTNAPLEGYANKLRQAGYSVNEFDGESYTILRTLADGVLYRSSLRFAAQPIGGGNPQIVMDFYAAGQPRQGILLNWPDRQLKAYLGEEVTDPVPAYAGRQYGFEFESSNSHALINVYVDSAAEASIKENYVGLLTTAGYTLKNNKYVSRSEQIAVSLNETNGQGVFQIAVEKIVHVQVTWPAQAIAEAIKSNIGNDVTDTIPTLDVSNASACTVNNNYTDYHFEINIDGLASSKTSFESVFKNSGWTYDAYYQVDYNQTGAFISPNKQMVAYFYTVSNDLVISIKAYFNQQYSWPTNDINSYLSAWGVSKDTVPAFDKALIAQVLGPEDDVKEFKVLISTSNNELAYSQYGELIKRAGYEIDRELNGYVTENRELLLKLVLDSSNGANYLMLSVAYIGSEPQQEQVFKVVGSFNNWSYENGVAFTNATNPDEVEEGKYVSQLKASFHVDAEDEFKLFDGTGDEGWIGGEILEPKDGFTVLRNGNIKAEKAGNVDLYFKTYSNGSKGLAIVFDPDSQDLVPWPSDFVEAVFAKWDVNEVLPEITNEAITEFECTPSEEGDSFEIKAIGGGNLVEDYEGLLDDDGYEYDEGEGFWVSESGKLNVNVSSDQGDLFIEVGLAEVEEPEPWPEDDIIAIIGDERYIIDLSISGASYVVSREEEEGSVFAQVIYTLEGKTSSVAIKEVLGLLNDAEYILVDKMEYPDMGIFMYQYFTGDMYIVVSTSDETHLSVMFMPGYTMPTEGYGFFVMNQDGTYESLVGEQVDNFGEYAQYKISEYDFKAGQMIVLFNFSAHQDFQAELENAGEYIEWDEDEECYVVKQDFTAEVYIKLKYEDNKLYFAIVNNE